MARLLFFLRAGAVCYVSSQNYIAYSAAALHTQTTPTKAVLLKSFVGGVLPSWQCIKSTSYILF
jgi:hypothetical protein